MCIVRATKMTKSCGTFELCAHNYFNELFIKYGIDADSHMICDTYLSQENLTWLTNLSILYRLEINAPLCSSGFLHNQLKILYIELFIFSYF